jgi:hypothetical protein
LHEKIGKDLDSVYFKRVEENIKHAVDVNQFLDIIHSLVDDVDRNFDTFGDEGMLNTLQNKIDTEKQETAQVKNLQLQIKFANEYHKMISKVKCEISERFQLLTEYKRGLLVDYFHKESLE